MGTHLQGGGLHERRKKSLMLPLETHVLVLFDCRLSQKPLQVHTSPTCRRNTSSMIYGEVSVTNLASSFLDHWEDLVERGRWLGKKAEVFKKKAPQGGALEQGLFRIPVALISSGWVTWLGTRLTKFADVPGCISSFCNFEERRKS